MSLEPVLPSADLARAVAALRRGGVVAFPTETVYGLGADATNAAAIARVFDIKGRPSTHPLIVHLGDVAWLDAWAIDVPHAARRLAARFWPGPLTLVLRRAPRVGDEVTGGQDTVGVRVPGHPVALALLHAFGSGIAAPSANRFGRISPTTAAHVRADLGDAVDVVLDGGPCEVGIESTIVDVSGGVPVLLRPGRLSAEELAAVAGQPFEAAGTGAPRAPGTLESHYAPRTPLRMLPRAQLPGREPAGRPKRSAVLAFDDEAADGALAFVRASTDPARYAHDLYARLRELDASGADVILVEAPPEGPSWEGVRDRLRRASVR